jgi:hypothetical protein
MDEIPNDNTSDFDFKTKKSNKNLYDNLYNNDDKENFETNFKNKNNN